MTVVVRKLGVSLAIVIPKEIARDMSLKEGSVLDMSGNADGISLRPKGRRPRRPIFEIVAAISPAAYRRRNRAIV